MEQLRTSIITGNDHTDNPLAIENENAGWETYKIALISELHDRDSGRRQQGQQKATLVMEG